MINFDDLVRRDFPIEKVRNDNKTALQHPSRTIVAGMSGAGKTNLVMNALFNPEHKMTFDKVIICSKMANTEDKYKWLKDRLEKIAEQIAEATGEEIPELVKSYNNLDDLPPVQELATPIAEGGDEQIILILDDFMKETTTDKKNIPKLLDYFIIGRKYNVSVIILTQKYHAINLEMRAQCRYWVLFGVTSRELDQIYRDLPVLGLDTKEFKKMFNENVVEDHSLIIVDKLHPDVDKRVRTDWDKYVDLKKYKVQRGKPSLKTKKK